MGYELVIVLAVVIFVGLAIAFMTGAKNPQRGQLPTQPSQPAADAPTPGASTVESAAQIDHARKHTPPA